MKMKSMIAAGLLLSSGTVYSANFGYSYLGLNLGKLTLDEELVFLGEVYEEFGLANIEGSYQIADNAALLISTSAIANDGPNTEINASQLIIGGQFPVAVNSSVDIIPSVGMIRSSIELCEGKFCFKDNDSGLAYGLSVRAWAAQEALELSIGIGDTTLDGSEHVISLGGALWFAEKHSVRADYGTSKEDSSFTLGYRYTW